MKKIKNISFKWACLDSNQKSYRYEQSALTNLATDPTIGIPGA